MSCPNFRFMKYGLPMICGQTFSQMAEDYEENEGKELTAELYNIFQQEEMELAGELADSFNNDLVFHEVTVVSGYYDSFQFYVQEKYDNIFDLDANSKYCIDNEDAKYYFDMYRSQVLRKSAAEKRKIEKWLYSLKNMGYNLVHCLGVFSNGEAVYSIA